LSEHASFEPAQPNKQWYKSPIAVKQPQILSEGFELAQVVRKMWFKSPIAVQQPQILSEHEGFEQSWLGDPSLTKKRSSTESPSKSPHAAPSVNAESEPGAPVVTFVKDGAPVATSVNRATAVSGMALLVPVVGAVGSAVGVAVGTAVGKLVGSDVGSSVGVLVGTRVGVGVGSAVGETVGPSGTLDGSAVGGLDGPAQPQDAELQLRK
jgi:hypothetical protein